MAWKVLFFQTARGDSPVKEFLQEQDKTTYMKLIHAIELLENGGPFLKPPYIKKLQNKLYELRISGNAAIRIFIQSSMANIIYFMHLKEKPENT